MTQNIFWHGDKFMRDLRAEQVKRVTRAAIVVERQMKRNLSVSGTGVIQGGIVVPAIKRTKKTVYGAFPSKPGESPHKQTGRLRASVTYEVDAFQRDPVARVGTNVVYGFILEAFRNRPWLVKSFNQVRDQVRSILAAPWTWNG